MTFSKSEQITLRALAMFGALGLGVEANAAGGPQLDLPTIGGLPQARFLDQYVISTTSRDIPVGTSDARIGRGYDSATDEIKEQCVVFNGSSNELVTVLPTNSGDPDAQSTYFKITHATDGQELLTSLSINASASFGFGFFSGDAAVSYATSRKITRYGEYLVINERVLNLTQFLKNIALTPAAQKVVNNPFKFRKMCGDQFLVGIVTGGEFAAIFNASSTTEEQQTSASLAFSASALGNSLDVQTTTKLSDLVNQGRLEMEILRKGPSDDIPNPTIDAIKAYAQALPGKVKPHGGTPWPIEMSTKGYGSLGPAVTDAQSSFLDAAGSQYMQLRRFISGLEYVNDHQDMFGGFDSAKYGVEHTSALQDAAALQLAAGVCAKDATKCSRPAFVRPRELPGRISWKPINPTEDAWTEIAVVQADTTFVVEARGQFSFISSGNNWYPASVGFFLIHNNLTGQDEKLPANRIYPVNKFAAVSYRIFDSYYPDNRPRPDDPLRAAVYEPVYPLPLSAFIR
jgi:hypothetical protein